MISKNKELKEFLDTNYSKSFFEHGYPDIKDVLGNMDERMMDEKMCAGLLEIDSGVLYEIPLVCCTRSILYYGINRCIRDGNFEDKLWIYCYLLYLIDKDLTIFDPLLKHDTKSRNNPGSFFTDDELESFESDYPLSSNASGFEVELQLRFYNDEKVNVYLITKKTSFTEEEARDAFRDKIYPEQLEEDDEEEVHISEEEWVDNNLLRHDREEGYYTEP